MVWVTTAEQREACFAIRRKVFIEEQAVPEELELDDLDLGAIHLLAMTCDGVPVGTARLLTKPTPTSSSKGMVKPQVISAKIGRVSVLPVFRGQGIARSMMSHLEEKALACRFTEIQLDAQIAVIPMYEGLGYSAYGPVFDDAGIDHRKMRKNLLQEIF